MRSLVFSVSKISRGRPQAGGRAPFSVTPTRALSFGAIAASRTGTPAPLVRSMWFPPPASLGHKADQRAARIPPHANCTAAHPISRRALPGYPRSRNAQAILPQAEIPPTRKMSKHAWQWLSTRSARIAARADAATRLVRALECDGQGYSRPSLLPPRAPAARHLWDVPVAPADATVPLAPPRSAPRLGRAGR